MATIRRFEDLECWQKARYFCQQVHIICLDTNLAKDFALKDQLSRSSGSAMDNIAEGFYRGGNKEFIQFLYTAKSSASESKSQLYRILDRKYIDEQTFEKLYTQADETQKLIAGLIKYLDESDFKGKKFKNR